MASSNASKIRSSLALPLLFAALMAGAPAVAQAPGGSIEVLPAPVPSTTVSSTAAEIAPVGPSPSPAAGPQTCATDYHDRLGAIAGRELKALKAVRAGVGAIDPGLPGRLIFTSASFKPTQAETDAVATAANLARLRGQPKGQSTANSRWIVERIVTDLTDYLTQGPSPFLCSGVANYLATLRTYSDQIAALPASRDQSIEVQRQATTASLHAVAAAMRPAPRPTFAPSDRPGALVAENTSLRTAVDMDLRTGGAIPIRLAGNRSSDERLSDLPLDPDLLPLSGRPGIALQTRRDLVRAVDDLRRRAEAGGFLAPVSRVAASARLAERRPVPAHSRPVLTRLARIEVAMQASAVVPAPAPADPRVMPALVTALADIEALDYLMADAEGAGDPLGTALAATLDAIEAAHAAACACQP